MKIQRTYSFVIIIFLLIALSSCKEKKEDLLIQQKIEKRNLEIEKIKAKYSGLVNMDTLSISNYYSVELNDKLKSKTVIVKSFSTIDIYLKDSIYQALLLTNSFFNNDISIYLELEISPAQYELLKLVKPARYGGLSYFDDGLDIEYVIIAEMTDFRKMHFISEESQLEITYTTTYDNLIAKGKIIEIIKLTEI